LLNAKKVNVNDHGFESREADEVHILIDCFFLAATVTPPHSLAFLEQHQDLIIYSDLLDVIGIYCPSPGRGYAQVLLVVRHLNFLIMTA